MTNETETNVNVEQKEKQTKSVYELHPLRSKLFEMDYDLIMDGLDLNEDYLVQNKYIDLEDQILKHAQIINNDYQRDTEVNYILDDIVEIRQIDRLRRIIRDTNKRLYELEEDCGYRQKIHKERDELVRKIDIINDAWDRINNKPSGCVFMSRSDVHVLTSWMGYISGHLKDEKIDDRTMSTMRLWADQAVSLLNSYKLTEQPEE